MAATTTSSGVFNVEDCERTTFGTHLCTDGRQYFVRNVYPPIQELQPRVLFVVIIFVLCFIVGICGNSSILTIIRGIVSERQASGGSVGGGSSVCGGGAASKNSDNAILYIAALCVVDFLMSLSLPPAILDSIIGFWMFGTVICKLHHVCGSVGRIVSTFLITAMSFDRFVAVCHPYRAQHFRSRRFVITTIVALWTVAFVLLLPMLTYAKANEILLHQVRHPTDAATGIENVTRVRVYKCSDMMPSTVFYWFTSSTFLLGYLVPLVLIVFFNSKLIRKLYRHTKVLPRSGIPLRRISVYTILIAVLYFVCWTPYWCSVLYAIYMSLFAGDGRESQSSELLLFIIYCVHLLPYFGSASNWILYGLLNTQLQIKHDYSGGNGNNMSNNNNNSSLNSYYNHHHHRVSNNSSYYNNNYSMVAATTITTTTQPTGVGGCCPHGNCRSISTAGMPVGAGAGRVVAAEGRGAMSLRMSGSSDGFLLARTSCAATSYERLRQDVTAGDASKTAGTIGAAKDSDDVASLSIARDAPSAAVAADESTVSVVADELRRPLLVLPADEPAVGESATVAVVDFAVQPDEVAAPFKEAKNNNAAHNTDTLSVNGIIVFVNDVNAAADNGSPELSHLLLDEHHQRFQQHHHHPLLIEHCEGDQTL